MAGGGSSGPDLHERLRELVIASGGCRDIALSGIVGDAVVAAAVRDPIDVDDR